MGKVLFAAVSTLGFATAWAQHGSSAQNMTLLASQDLQARSAYQPTIHRQGNRWIAYIGHHGGTNEVPKPRNPLTGAEEFNWTLFADPGTTTPYAVVSDNFLLARLPLRVGTFVLRPRAGVLHLETD